MMTQAITKFRSDDRKNNTVFLKLFGFLALTLLLVSCSTTNSDNKSTPVIRASSNNTQTVKSPAAPSLAPAPKGYHRVSSGENLYRISLKYKTSVAHLTQLNNISDPAQLTVGQLILVPNDNHRTGNSSHKQPLPTSKPEITNSRILTDTGFSWPVVGTIISHFNGTTSKGIDIRVAPSTPVKASRDGKVIYNNYVSGYGNLILIGHDANNSILTAYAHNQEVMVKLNQMVKQGQVIATAGTDDSGQPVLHFEIRRNGKAINPVSYLK